MAKYINADTVVSMPFLDDSYGIEKHTVETDTIENLLDRFTKEGCTEPADVVSVSAYKQMMLEKNTAVEQLKQIGKDIREVIDDVVHLQKLLSDVVQVDAIIQFIETRKQLHSSPAWYEFGIVKELDEVKRFVEKMQAEEDNDQ